MKTLQTIRHFSTQKKAIIIGAGIGGVTLANALIKSGHSVSIYDRTKELNPRAGAGFGLTSGAAILRKELGINVRDFGAPMNKMIQKDLKTQKIFCELNFEKALPSIHSDLSSCIRSEMVTYLANLLPKETLHLQHEFKSLEENKDGTVTVSFTNGTKATGDFVVGCDGIRSAVRKQTFGLKEPVYSGICIWYGLSSYRLPAGEINWNLGNGEIVGYFPVGKDGKESIVFREYKSPIIKEESWLLGDNKEEIMKIVKNYPEPIPSLFAASTNLLHLGLHYHEPLKETWSKGKVVLLGDSCHATLPTIGQGANMAIDDAIYLTRMINKYPNDLEIAFKEYHKERQPKTQTIVDFSTKYGAFEVTNSKLGIWFRNNAIKFAGRTGLLEKSVFGTVKKALSSIKID